MEKITSKTFFLHLVLYSTNWTDTHQIAAVYTAVPNSEFINNLIISLHQSWLWCLCCTAVQIHDRWITVLAKNTIVLMVYLLSLPASCPLGLLGETKAAFSFTATYFILEPSHVQLAVWRQRQLRKPQMSHNWPIIALSSIKVLLKSQYFSLAMPPPSKIPFTSSQIWFSVRTYNVCKLCWGVWHKGEQFSGLHNVLWSRAAGRGGARDWIEIRTNSSFPP